MACQIKRNSNGAITQVLAPNGKDSILYRDIVNNLSNPQVLAQVKQDPYVSMVLGTEYIKGTDVSEVGLAAWSKAYSAGFINQFGDWKTQTIANTDVNGEPSVDALFPSTQITSIGPAIFDKQLAQKIQAKLQALYPEIKLNITNNPVWEKGDNILNQEQFNLEVNYRLKTTKVVLDNYNKIRQWESNKSIDQDILYKKIGELGISNQQLELLKESEGNTVEEKLINFISSYNYTVEINTAKTNVDIRSSTQKFFKVDGKEYGSRYNSDTYEVEYFYLPPYPEPKVKISEKEFNNLFQKASYTPTQYYSSITVPGGTNYTENEIATPAITPSIKGHAQFATDKGIGWFRSDDKEMSFQSSFVNSDGSVENIFDQTKIRRILEVQSDLFQKGRDKEDLADKTLYRVTGEKVLRDPEDGSYYTEPFSEDIYVDNNEDLAQIMEYYGNQEDLENLEYNRVNFKNNINRQNQFLQLINKNNNWVNFFVKAIIQDSAEKGYEKVLFPTGNTASKVEGHTTLEEFKKQKENRIKELENEIENSGNIIDNFTNKGINYFLETPYGKITESNYDIEGNFITKNVVTYYKEDNTTPEGYLKGKQKITASEYKKAAKEAGININYYKLSEEQIVNKENEIRTLKQELERVETEGFGALKPIYNFYETTLANVLKKQGYNPILITDEYGNTWNEVIINQARDLSEILLQRNKANQIIGQANIKALTVLIDAVNQKQDTLPHEYAHHYISWYRNTPIVQEAIKKWGSEEALVQAIGEQVVKQKGEAYNWWKNFVRWILNQFNKLSTLQKEELAKILTDAFLTRQDLNIQPDLKTSNVKEGVDFVFEQNPELASIGTQEQYSEYLDTIFPDSKVKDIVTHNSPNKFEKFNVNRGRLGAGVYFGLDYKIYNTGQYNYNALLNIKNLKRYDKGDFVITANRLYPSQDEYSTKPQDTLRAADEASGVDGYVSTSPVGTEFLVFEPDQIHILGSKKDIEGFKKFVSGEQLPSTVDNIINMKRWTQTKNNCPKL